MPNRVIKESIKVSEQINSLTWFEEVVYYRLIVSADDFGCYDGRPVLLKNELFPLKESVTRKSIEDAIAKLVSVGLLCQYTANGMPYLCFPTWRKHQRLRRQYRKYPEPPENLLTVNCQSNDGQSTADCPPESESEIESEIESESQYRRAEQPSRRSAPAASPSVFNIPLNDGTDWNVPQEDINTYRQLYPAVDVESEIRAMIGWCMSNPTRRKTNSGIRAFINRWLKKAQDQGGTRSKSRDNPALDFAQREYTDAELNDLILNMDYARQDGG